MILSYTCGCATQRFVALPKALDIHPTLSRTVWQNRPKSIQQWSVGLLGDDLIRVKL
jgi:hypothetical protein